MIRATCTLILTTLAVSCGNVERTSELKASSIDDPMLASTDSVPVYQSSRVGVFYIRKHLAPIGSGGVDVLVGSHYVFVKSGPEGFVEGNSFDNEFEGVETEKATDADMKTLFSIDARNGFLRGGVNEGSTKRH